MVEGIADAAANGTLPVGADLHAGIVIVVPVIIDITFDAEHQIIVELVIVTNEGAENAAIEIIRGDRAAGRKIAICPARAALNTKIGARPGEDRQGFLRDRRCGRFVDGIRGHCGAGRQGQE
ncbi:hypothetical protein D3C78_1081710 [compost metagenome]